MYVFRYYAAVIATFLLLISSLTAEARAQAYPVKPVRMVLPFPAGAPSDIVGRTIGQKLSEQFGQNFIPDNRPGAGGNLALGMAASAAPDGYTVVVTSPTIAISPSLYSKLSYNAFKDLVPVARLATIENVMVVHPSVPAKTLKQFIALARSRPGVLNYGSGGAGTTNHLANELLKHLEKINMVHVPYKGATLATVAAISGEVDEVIVSVASALSLIKQGKVRPLAVLSEKRVATLPNVPTSKEAGVDGFQVSIWYGMFAPSGTPHAIIARLNQEVFRALESREMRQRMDVMSINPWPGTPEQMRELLRTETARYAAIIKSAGLRPQ